MSLLQSARAIAHTLLQVHQGEISDQVLINVIEKAAAINIIDGQNFDKRELFEILRADFSIGKGEITILSEDIEPWLNDEKANINFELWNRYKLYMAKNDPSFPLNDLDDFTDKILDKCVNPKKKVLGIGVVWLSDTFSLVKLPTTLDLSIKPQMQVTK